jgi:hypothetical protein
MKLSSIIPVISAILLSSCAADKEMYKAYVDITKTNNSIKREELSQKGKTARAAILAQSIKDDVKDKLNNVNYSRKPIKKVKNTLYQRVRRHNDKWYIMSISSAPPCSVICTDGCSEECLSSCPDLCDELDQPEEPPVNLYRGEDVSAYDKQEYKSVSQDSPVINVIGSSDVVINLGAGASTTAERKRETIGQIRMPKSTSQTATEGIFSLGTSLLKWGSIFGIADTVFDGMSRISEAPNNYVDNTGRSEVFDSRNQSTNGE